MKTLVIFYSFEGNTRFIAQQLAKSLQADTMELQVAKKYPTKGLQKYLWGGKSVLLGEQPPLTNPMADLDAYQNIVLGSPVWAGSFAPPMHTFLQQHAFHGKNVALFACHGGGGAQKCFAKMRESIPNNTFVGDIAFLDPLQHTPDTAAQKAAAWAEKLPF